MLLTSLLPCRVCRDVVLCAWPTTDTDTICTDCETKEAQDG